MKIKPVLTEKSMGVAKSGIYTFWVPSNLTKHKIKDLISMAYGVTVTTVKTSNCKKRVRRNLQQKLVTTKAKKRAMVTLKDKETISAFGEKNKKKKK